MSVATEITRIKNAKSAIKTSIENKGITVSESTKIDGYSTLINQIQTKKEEEEKTVDLDMASGNQVVDPTSGKVISKLTITKPSTLIAGNIKKSVVIAGITGTYEFTKQAKEFTPTLNGSTVTADSGYDGLSSVTVNPVPVVNKTDIPLNFYNSSAGTILNSQNVYSDDNKFMTWVNITRPDTLIASNIKKGVTIAGIQGTLEPSNVTSLKGLLDATKRCSELFYNYDGTSVAGLIAYDDTSDVTTMYGMFSNCSKLTTIPLLNSSNVITMEQMFWGCSKLTTIPQLDTSNVGNMYRMFNGCTNLKSILMTGMKVNFDISASTQFERSDLVTILNNLATVTTTKTLTMGATNLAKLTDSDKEIATNKGWTLA